MSEEGRAPCGMFVDDTRHEQWRQEFSCLLFGCEKCLMRNGGPVYYEPDFRKAIGIWVKHQWTEKEVDYEGIGSL